MKTPQLTGRERDIVVALTTGASNRDIARWTGLKEGTVKEYMGRICRKFGLRNRVEVAMWAARQGGVGAPTVVASGPSREGHPPRVS